MNSFVCVFSACCPCESSTREKENKTKQAENNANGQKDFRNGKYIHCICVCICILKNKMEDNIKYL